MSKTILTVDDSASVRQLVKLTLQGAGFDVVEAQNGQDAMTKLTKPIEMVITDLNMPIVDGIGLIRLLRAHPSCKYVPIVVLTTESQPAKKQEAKAAGATGWIIKPFQQDQLLAVVKRVLG